MGLFVLALGASADCTPRDVEGRNASCIDCWRMRVGVGAVAVKGRWGAGIDVAGLAGCWGCLGALHATAERPVGC
jgi:hypothetical protein